MKELEALKRLRDGYYNGYYKQFTSSEAKIDEDYNMVLNALTPPTADEVCKALSDELGYKVEYEKIYSSFYYHYGKEPYEIVSICSMGDKMVGFKFPLPPHLITLIGRFYENEVKGE